MLSLIDYGLSLFSEAINAKMPKVSARNLSEELGLMIGTAKVQDSWREKGIPLVRPEILSKEERITDIKNAYNTTLIYTVEKDNLIPNDILSNPDRNLFVIEGPNNGGKTTYLRHVGQMHWLAQLGMFLPARSAKLSLIDGVYVSFSGGDDTEEGTGQYLTELNRIRQFTMPDNGDMHATPYSLILFDEFANGTDNDEAVYRTKIVLDYLSRKGVTAYFTTHKHEIGEYVENGKLSGAVNLAAKVEQNGKGIILTHKIEYDKREKSYGNIIAESAGVTEEGLNSILEKEIHSRLYPIEHTRIQQKA